MLKEPMVQLLVKTNGRAINRLKEKGERKIPLEICQAQFFSLHTEKKSGYATRLPFTMLESTALKGRACAMRSSLIDICFFCTKKHQSFKKSQNHEHAYFQHQQFPSLLKEFINGVTQIHGKSQNLKGSDGILMCPLIQNMLKK